MELFVSSRIEFVFHPVTESEKLEDNTRALVKDKDGFMRYALWSKSGGWYDEGNVCYCGVGGLLDDIVEFSISK
jgi:hypothetical protein